MNASGIITLTSDFGLEDPYAAVMKGVILSINPRARIVDITHKVDRGSPLHGALIMREASPWFPSGTVHVAVVDPGVGGERRAILVIQENHFFVGPDNGLFSPVITGSKDSKVIHLTKEKFFMSPVSRTFHGRDIFAPVGARLSLGADPAEMGDRIGDPEILEFPDPRRTKDALWGKILRTDHFGNLITNIRREDIEQFSGSGPVGLEIQGVRLAGVYGTYAEAPEGELMALIGSAGYLEIAVNKGSASQRLDLEAKGARGTEIKILRL